MAFGRISTAMAAFALAQCICGGVAVCEAAPLVAKHKVKDCALDPAAIDCGINVTTKSKTTTRSHQSSSDRRSTVEDLLDLAVRTHDRLLLNQYNQLSALRTRCKDLIVAKRSNPSDYRRHAGFYAKNCASTRVPPIQITEYMVREQFRRLPLPKGDLVFQPSWGALVNKREIFYTRAERDQDYRLSLLGHQVELHAHVQSYVWSWGDGSTDLSSDVPGGPYPDFDVSHTYRSPGKVSVAVALTYSATYSVDGGPVQRIQGTATVAGDPAAVRVVDAHAVLVEGDH